MNTLKGYDLQAGPVLTWDSDFLQPISMKRADNSPPTSLNSAETLSLQQPNSFKAPENALWKSHNSYKPLKKSIDQHPRGIKSEEIINWGVLSLEDSILAYGQLDECPSIDSFLCTLQKCRKQRSLFHALHMHLYICNHGLETHFVLKSHLVSMFVECGSIVSAQLAFNRLCERSEFIWTCLMQGYVDSGEPQFALSLVREMKEDGFVPTKFTYVTLLKACAKLQWLESGQELHEELGEMGMESDLFVGSALVDMYAKCGLLEKAQDVFDGLSDRSIVSWTALIAGYAEYGTGEKARECLEQMHLEGISPDTGLFVCSLKACKNLGDLHEGFGMHADVVKRGFEGDPVIGHVLMDMYAKCSSLEETRCVFDRLTSKSVVSWTILISRYSDHGHNQEALKCLEQMQVQGECPNDITLVSSLKACKDIGALDKGREIHTIIVREELEKVPYVCNTLIDFYATHCLIEEAHQVFEELQVHDAILWTTLITAYAECGLMEKALNCFQQMQLEGASPDVATFNAVILGCAVQKKSEEVSRMYLCLQEQGLLPNSSTFLSVLKACKNKSVLAFGKTVHVQLLSSGGQKAVEIQLATVLFDMYAKCGSMQDAQHVFNSMPSRDIIAWTALITGHAGRGESSLVFELLERMKREGMSPDKETFLSVLIACTHAGLVDEGLIFFESMSKDFGIAPTLEHINCIVDLLGRVGRLNEAVTMLKQSLIPPDQVMWATVLAACRKWHDVQVARHAFECAVTLDKSYTPAYSLMANIYADAQLWEEMKIVEALRIKQG